MSDEEYTPMTSDIRDAWATDEQGYRYGAHDAEFDRWLAAHDAEVAARALREAAEYLFEDEDAGLNVVLGGPGYVHYWLRERADRIERQEGDR